MSTPLFSALPKTANDLFTQEAKDFSSRTEYSSLLKNGVEIKFEGVRSDEDGGVTSALVFKKQISIVDFTARFSSDKSSTITLENSSLFPNLTLRLDRPLTPAATLTKIALPANSAPAAPADKKPASAPAATASAAAAPAAVSAAAAAEAAVVEVPRAPILTAEYTAADFSASSSLDVAKKEANLSGVLQHSGVFLGISSTYSLAEGSFNGTQFRASRVGGDDGGAEYSAFVDGANEYGFSVYRSVGNNLSLGAGVERTPKGFALLVGGEKQLGKSASVRGDANLSNGVVSAIYRQSLKSKATLVAAAQLNLSQLTAGNAHRVGLSILLGQ